MLWKIYIYTPECLLWFELHIIISCQVCNSLSWWDLAAYIICWKLVDLLHLYWVVGVYFVLQPSVFLFLVLEISKPVKENQWWSDISAYLKCGVCIIFWWVESCVFLFVEDILTVKFAKYQYCIHKQSCGFSTLVWKCKAQENTLKSSTLDN